jgi:hypothetical protein
VPGTLAHRLRLAGVACLMAAMAAARPAAAQAPNYPAILQAVARDIAALKPGFAQLKDFSPPKNLDRSDRDHW